MGVPSYFAYIIRNHPNIIKKLFLGVQIQQNFERLYMDCNSILYDSYYEIKHPENMEEDVLYKTILDKTTTKIEDYIYKIKPRDTLFIAFDGVAPFAKMEQQRNRRYKSWYQTFMDQDQGQDPSSKITTSMFTPGTKFMQLLSVHMETHFLKQEHKYRVREILIATPREAGEGEHKLYEHLRKYPMREKVAAIYGLDADLIMLSLFHLSFVENIFVFREAPEFLKASIGPDSGKGETESKELWGLDMVKLGNSIANEMACIYPDNHRMYDYVFLCFFLGNDFLPHFPALNIRTQGIQRLMDTYRMCIGNKPNCFLISKTNPNAWKIQWREVYKLIFFLAKHETNFIKQEYAVRKKWDYVRNKYEDFMNNPKKQKLEKKEYDEMIQNVPVIFREEETYICPYEYGWENRYYERLFPLHVPVHVHEINSEFQENGKRKTSKIAVHYLEGLEWVFRYYTSGCVHWKWKYPYMYPPLLVDLLPHVPNKNDYEFFYRKRNFVSMSPYAQMAYVLPRGQLHLLPEKHRSWLIENHPEWYPLAYSDDQDNRRTGPKYKWAFCRYLWESHVCLPEISLDIVEKEFAKL